MNIMPLIIGAILAVTTLAGLVLTARSVVARVIASILALGGAAFCAFGFLASFEPSDLPNWPWQIAYAILGLSSLIAAVLLLKGAGRA